MQQQPFVIEKTFDAPINRVWQAITDAGQMKHWYFDIASFKPEVGFEFEFAAGKEGEKPYIHQCRVTQVVPGKKLAYSWQYKDYEGYSEVTFELFPDNGGTRLVLTHSGLESFPNLPDFRPESFAQGWTHIVGKSLGEYLENN